MGICYLILIGIIVLLAICGILCRIISSNNSSIGKKSHALCNDIEINTAFNTISITGVELLENLLKVDHLFEEYTIHLKHIDGRHACVNRNSIELSRDFENNIELETFRDILHEYKHVLDSRLLMCMRRGIYGWGIGTVLIAFEMVLVINTLINSHWILILPCIISISSFLVFILFKINIEIRAIRFVPASSKSVLNKLGIVPNQEIIITEYLKEQSKSICIWYTLEIISKYLFALIITLILTLFLLLAMYQ